MMSTEVRWLVDFLSEGDEDGRGKLTDQQRRFVDGEKQDVVVPFYLSSQMANAAVLADAAKGQRTRVTFLMVDDDSDDPERPVTAMRVPHA